jgi:hypothetical protein
MLVTGSSAKIYSLSQARPRMYHLLRGLRVLSTLSACSASLTSHVLHLGSHLQNLECVTC